MQTFTYRPDIDGLRAIAVLAVILYHANSSWLPGGFTGVDIFFVISGFLITQIIHLEITQNRFSIRQFYLRRIKRILPAFFAVILFCLIIGFILFSPREYAELAKSARYAITFLANHYFAKEQDYFAPAAEEIPLLHMWSLSVEEQYYFLWPALLLLLRRRPPLFLLIIPAALMAGSFVLSSIWASNQGSLSNAYYLLPSRFGELMIGSMLALHAKPCQSRPLANLVAASGAGLLCGSFIFLGKQSVFPGYNALWPCLGTAFLIYAGSNPQNLISQLLGWRVLTFTGLLSYSLYLWHWPILAFTRYFFINNELSEITLLACLASTGLAGYLSWRFIEQPVRQMKLTFRAALTGIFIIPSIVLLSFFALLKGTGGYLWRDSSHGLDTIDSPSLVCHNRIATSCQAGDTTQAARTLIIGDSHSAHLTTFFDLLGKKQGWSADIISVDSCPPFTLTNLENLHHSKQRQRCSQLISHIKSNIERYDNIVYSLRWELHMGYTSLPNYQPDPLFHKHLEHDITLFSGMGKHVYLVSQVPLYQFPVSRLFRTNKGNNPINANYLNANNLLKTMIAQYPHSTYIDIASIAAQWDNGIIDNLPAYKDENHLNIHGQRKLAEQRQTLEWLGNSLKETTPNPEKSVSPSMVK